jgi:hypothetical protein
MQLPPTLHLFARAQKRDIFAVGQSVALMRHASDGVVGLLVPMLMGVTRFMGHTAPMAGSDIGAPIHTLDGVVAGSSSPNGTA